MKNTKIKGKFRKIIALVAIAVICAAFLACDTDSTDSLDGAPLLGSGIDPKSWMSQLPDTLLITQIAIPGTHDSSTYHSTINDPTTRCQERDFMTQLNQGIRYFDFRLGSRGSNEALKFFHGPIDQHVTLDEVMRTFRTFLEANPREILFVQIKPEHDENVNGKNFAQRVREQTYESPTYRHLWSTNSLVSNMYLYGLRGKIVLIRNYTGSTSGIDLYSVKSKNENTRWGGWVGSSFHIEIQDYFDISGHILPRFDSDVTKKKRYIKDLIDYAIYNKTNESRETHYLNLNFWSHSFALGTSPQGYAGEINRYMRYSGMFTTKVPGVQLMDFYWTENVNDIIASNFIQSGSGSFVINTGIVENGSSGDSVVRKGGDDDDINSQRNRSTNWKLDITMSYENPSTVKVDFVYRVTEVSRNYTDLEFTGSRSLSTIGYTPSGMIHYFPPQTESKSGTLNGQHHTYVNVGSWNSGLIRNLSIKIDGPGDDRNNIGFNVQLYVLQ